MSEFYSSLDAIFLQVLGTEAWQIFFCADLTIYLVLIISHKKYIVSVLFNLNYFTQEIHCLSSI